LQEGEHQTIPQLQDQVPIGFQENPTTIQEAEDHIQGQQAQLVYVMWLSFKVSRVLSSILFVYLLPDFALRIFRQLFLRSNISVFVGLLYYPYLFE
jgi:hypothetical protein